MSPIQSFTRILPSRRAAGRWISFAFCAVTTLSLQAVFKRALCKQRLTVTHQCLLEKRMRKLSKTWWSHAVCPPYVPEGRAVRKGGCKNCVGRWRLRKAFTGWLKSLGNTTALLVFIFPIPISDFKLPNGSPHVLLDWTPSLTLYGTNPRALLLQSPGTVIMSWALWAFSWVTCCFAKDNSFFPFFGSE